MEVMAAVVVISIMALTAIHVVKNTNDELINVSSSRRAYELAQEKLYEIVNSQQLVGYTGSSGTYNDDDQGYKWSAQVESTAAPKVFILVVSVEKESVKAKVNLDYLFYAR